MKRLLFLFFIPLALQASAQDVTDTTASVSANDSASFTGNTTKPATFTVKRDKIVLRKVFAVNNAQSDQEIFSRAVAFARGVSAGYVADNKKKTITVPVTWPYSSRANECVEDMDMKGTMVIEVKNKKTRMTLTDITYEHFEKGTRNAIGIAKSDLISRKADCAPQKGAVELIYNCDKCQQSVNSLDGSLKTQFEMLTGRYQDALRRH